MSIERRLIGRVPVDSGTLMVVDPCYMACEPGQGSYQEPARVKAFLDAFDRGKIAWEERVRGLATGLTVSGFGGDGTYPVYAEIDEHGLVARIIVEFEAE